MRHGTQWSEAIGGRGGTAPEVSSTERRIEGTERLRVQTREWVLTAAVIVIPLIIASVVTIWSLDQVRYRPKKRRPSPVGVRESETPVDDGRNTEAGRRGSGDS